MAGPGEPLALDYAAFGQAGGARRGEDLIDALPYVDPLPPDTKRSVEQLIEEEMRRSSKRPADYLKELPEVPESVIPEDSLIMTELARLKAGEPMAQVDTTRYQLNPPPAAKKGDPGAWRAALDNTFAQREHQELRLMNLELQVKYGAAVWRAHNQHLDLLVKGYEKAVTELRREIEEINRTRKLHQVSAKTELDSLEAQWVAAVKKNADIEYQCKLMEEKLAQAEGAGGEGAGAPLQEGAEAMEE